MGGRTWPTPALARHCDTTRLAAFLCRFGIVGASTNRSKFGNKCFRALVKHKGSEHVTPVHHKEPSIEGVYVMPTACELGTALSPGACTSLCSACELGTALHGDRSNAVEGNSRCNVGANVGTRRKSLPSTPRLLSLSLPHCPTHCPTKLFPTQFVGLCWIIITIKNVFILVPFNFFLSFVSFEIRPWLLPKIGFRPHETHGMHVVVLMQTDPR